jgi:aromatic-L-amino-acid/L-tryptophan decarboxylase
MTDADTTDVDHSTRHMSAEEFRARGYQLVDWVADYLARVEDLPVLAQVEPGWVTAQLPPEAPEYGEAWEAILADLDRVVLPGVTHWQSPRFHAYFPANNSGPSILGELAAAGLGVQGMLWSTSPSCTELETVVLDWMAQLLELPDRFRAGGPGGGVIQDSASSAALVALLAARDRARAGGAAIDDLVVYVSTQTHSSLVKGARIAAVPTLRSIDVDDCFAMRPEALEQAMAEDTAAGLVPAFVCGTVGTTASHAVDPLAALGHLCQQHGAWFHVDAAHLGVAALCPEMRWVNDGLDLADSYSTNAHKWLFTNFDCSLMWLADRAPLLESLSILPEYLRNAASESGAVIDYRDWQVPLGRRFRALKLWMVLRHYGAEGLRHHLRQHVAITAELVDRFRADPRFEVVAPVPATLVCVRHAAGDDASRALLDAINGSGRAYLSHAALEDHFVIRVSIGSTLTERRHVDDLWRLFDEHAPAVC